MVYVETKAQLAARAGISQRTLEREISLGRGPALIQVSERRVGIAREDGDAWLASRRKPAPGDKQAAQAQAA
jgi:predicted DNA-binding transcriptional regulator AlpA